MMVIDKVKLVTLALVALSVVMPFTHAWFYLSQRALPWWSDPGEWLKYANAVEGEILLRLGYTTEDIKWKLYPMWDQGVFQYPPLLFLILSALSRILGPLLSLKLLGSLLLSMQPLPIYLLTRKIAGNIAGITAAFTASFMPVYVEMIGWGGYPNLLSFLLIGFTIYMILVCMDTPNNWRYSILALLAGLIPLTHHLTTGIFLGIITLWLVLSLILRTHLNFKPIFICLSSCLLALTAWFYLAFPFQLMPFNLAAYYGLRFDPLQALPWIFKETSTFIFTMITIMIVFTIKKILITRQYLSLLLSWVIFPTIATFGYLVGIAIDYNRVFFFALQAVPIIIAIPMAHTADLFRGITFIKSIDEVDEQIRTFLGRIRKVRLGSLSVAFMVFLSLAASLSTLGSGVRTVGNVASWVAQQDPYGDLEKLAALDWIRFNTKPDEVFVAQELMGRWIEGYAVRRVYMYMEPRFIFVQGQLDRYYMASSALKSVYEIRNGYIRIQDQNPNNSTYSPIISLWSLGEYKETLIVDDSLMNVTLSRNGNNNTLNLASISKINVTMSHASDDALIRVLYDNDVVDVVKDIKTSTEPCMDLSYSVYNRIPDTTLESITIALKISDRRVIRMVEMTPQEIDIHADTQTFMITTSQPVSTQRAYRSSDGNNFILISQSLRESNELKLRLTLISSSTDNRNDDVKTVDVRQLLHLYNISYIVLPFNVYRFSSDPEFEHLLKVYEIAYSNDKVIILRLQEKTM